MNNIVRHIFSGLSLFLATAPLAAIVLWLPFFPELIPAHYTGAIVDRMGSKYELLLLPACSIIIIGVLVFSYWLVNRGNVENQTSNYQLVSMYILYVFSVLIFIGFDIIIFYFARKAFVLVEPVESVNYYQVAGLAVSLIAFYATGHIPFTIGKALREAQIERESLPPDAMPAMHRNRRKHVLAAVKTPNCIATAMLSVVGLILLIFNFTYSGGYINIAVTATVFIVAVAVAITLVLVKSKKHTRANEDKSEQQQ